MYTNEDFLARTLDEIRAEGLEKTERVLESAQDSSIEVGRDAHLLNFCANNYLGLANHPRLVGAANSALTKWGFGLASVRFICGTQAPHLELEARIAEFLGTEASILFSSCFDANGGLFETLLGPDDAVISDALNHASIIDGIRLCKAKRYRYTNRDMPDLEQQLVAAEGARFKLVVTDGVFSMDGYLAPLDAICDLAEKYGALVMVDDSHAVGFMGKRGAGTPDHFGVRDRVDIVTGTLGKALGGASGGYVAAHREIVDLLRQRARPYLFSNSLAPSIVGASLEVLDLIEESADRRAHLAENAGLFRRLMTDAGFELLPGDHPIIPVMTHDANAAVELANALFARGVYVTPFSFPVVPRGEARIRVQMSAAHSTEDVEAAVAAFVAAREDLGG